MSETTGQHIISFHLHSATQGSERETQMSPSMAGLDPPEGTSTQKQDQTGCGVQLAEDTAVVIKYDNLCVSVQQREVEQ